MSSKRILMPILMFFFVFMLIKQSYSLAEGDLSNSRDVCENDRSCCMILNPTDNLNFVCARNDTQNWTELNHYNWTADQIFDITIDSQIPKMHYLGGDWTFFNKDQLNTVKREISRVQFRTYSEHLFGFGINDGGQTNNITWTPTKIIKHSDSAGTVPIGIFEHEIISDRRFLIMRGAFKCTDADDCDYTGGDSVQFKVYNRTGGKLTGIDYSTTIDNSFCGVIMNETLDATLDGAVVKEPARNLTFLFAFNRCPDNWTIDRINGQVNLSYNQSNNEIKNYTIVVTTSNNESYISNWTNDYYKEEKRVREDYQQFAESFKFPKGQSHTNISKYYKGVYTYWYTTNKQFEDNDTSSKWYVQGKPRYVNFPNSLGGYAGMWVWDSFNTGLGIISSLNYSHPSVGNVTSILRDWLYVWTENMDKYPTAGEWEQKIYEGGLGTANQAEGGWTLLSLWLYNISNTYNLGLINQSYFCNQTLQAMRSHFEGISTGANNLSSVGTGTLGRDATDIISSDSTDATGWRVLNALAMKKSYNLCGDTNNASLMQSYYDSIKTQWNAKFWNESQGIYWNLGSDDGGQYHISGGKNNDWAQSPYGICISLALNITQNSSQINSLLDKLTTNYTHSFALTSIPRNHTCYTPSGADNSCVSGETWDGATWAGVDNFWCLNALLELNKSRDATNNITWMVNENFNVFGQPSPFGMESYHSQVNSSLSEWNSNPYGWGGNIPTSAVNKFNIFDVLGLNAEATSTGNPLTVTITNNNNSILQNDRWNISCSASDGTLSTGNITYNLTGNSSLYNFSFVLSGSSATYSQNITVNVTAGSVLNATCWAKNSSNNEAQDSLTITIQSTSTILPDFYNLSHPRFFNRTPSEIKTDLTATNSIMLNRYNNFTSQAISDQANNFSDVCGGNSITDCNWRCERVTIQAVNCYLGNASSCNKGKEFLKGFLNFSTTSSNWTATDTDTRSCAGHVGLSYDLLYNNMSYLERNFTIKKMQDIIGLRFNTTGNELNASRISRHNGQGQNGADFLMVLAIRGEPPTDTNLVQYFNTTNMSIRNYWKAYGNSSVTMEGIAYQAFGLHMMVIATDALEKEYGRLGLSFDNICNVSESIPFGYKYKGVTSDSSITKNLTTFDYGDSSQNSYFEPQELIYFAKRCNQPALHHILSMQDNFTDAYKGYTSDNDLTAFDLIYYNNSIGQSMPQEKTYWWDNQGYVIWRSNFSFTNEFYLTFISGDEDIAHPQSDDLSMTLSYNGVNFLIESGDRNNTDEIPSGSRYTNTLMVDNIGDFNFGQRADYQPAADRQLTGWQSYQNVDECTDSNYTFCHNAPADFKGRITKYNIGNNYNEVQGFKPYYTLNNATRHIVYYHNASLDFVVERWFAENKTNNKNFTFTYMTQFNASLPTNNSINISTPTTNFLLTNVVNTSSCIFSNNTGKYHRRVDATTSIGDAYFNVLECNNTKNISIVNVMLPYSVSEGNPYTIKGFSNSTHIGANLTDNNSIQRLVLFSLSNIDTDALMITSNLTSLPDSTNPTITSTSINNTAPLQNEVVQFGINCTDETAIGSVYFAENLTGNFINFSSITGLSQQSVNYTTNLTNNLTSGNVIGGIFTCNDTSSNTLQSSIITFTVASSGGGGGVSGGGGGGGGGIINKTTASSANKTINLGIQNEELKCKLTQVKVEDKCQNKIVYYISNFFDDIFKTKTGIAIIIMAIILSITMSAMLFFILKT